MRILVADPLSTEGLRQLANVAGVDERTDLQPDELVSMIGDYEALIVRSRTKVTAEVIEAGRRLQVIGRAGIGVDNIDLEAATRCGVLVVNAPMGNVVAAAELTIGLLISLARSIVSADKSVRRGEWQRGRFLGVAVQGKTLGLVGLGNVGTEVARRAHGLGMMVMAYDPAVSTERAEQAGAALVDLDQLLSNSDFMSIHAPLTDTTRNLIGARELARARPGIRIINCARGGIIDEQALYDALVAGQVAGAAMDVFASEPPVGSPLLQLESVIVTPHLGASTEEAQLTVASDVAEEVSRVLTGGAARFPVNAPAIRAEEMAGLAPYMYLVEKMGRLYAQMESGRIGFIEVTSHGEAAGLNQSMLTASAITGVLSGFVEERITAINARWLASSKGIEIKESRVSAKDSNRSWIALKVGDSNHSLKIDGALVLGQARIVGLNDLEVDVAPQGRFLISQHDDRPGVIGKTGTILGKWNINIASMQVGRRAPRGQAMMIISVDDPVPDEALGELRATPGIGRIRYVNL